jgi:hypothetical protein
MRTYRYETYSGEEVIDEGRVSAMNAQQAEAKALTIGYELMDLEGDEMTTLVVVFLSTPQRGQLNSAGNRSDGR